MRGHHPQLRKVPVPPTQILVILVVSSYACPVRMLSEGEYNAHTSS